jgi:hypothetical protein
MSRWQAFKNFQFFAFSALVWGAEHVNGALRAAMIEGVRPRPCSAVLAAAFQLKLLGKERLANELLESVHA